MVKLRSTARACARARSPVPVARMSRPDPSESAPMTASSGGRLMNRAAGLMLVAGLGLAVVVLARSAFLPFARAVQARRGYSEQFAVDVTVTLAVGSFIAIGLALMAWVMA